MWSIGRGDYLWELWDTTGVRQAAIQRDADWFEPFVRMREIAPDGPTPESWISFAWCDPAGRLWIVARVAKKDWRELLASYPDFNSNDSHFLALFDDIVEVIDSQNGELLVSQVFPIKARGPERAKIVESFDITHGLTLTAVYIF